MSRYAVVDIETTGILPELHHKIVEVAVVLADDRRQPVREWETLINPVRDVGATEIHGITAADVYSAPTFDQVAPELASLLRGKVIVAHNLSFDAHFLSVEFARAGYAVGFGRTTGLCTMRLASHYLPIGARSLGVCCDCIGYCIDQAHSALCDARAAARLLEYYIGQDEDFAGYWADVISAAEKIEWPSTSHGGRAVALAPRKTAGKRHDEHFLGRLVSRAPRCETHPEANSYLAVVDRVLLDRQISLHEADELVAVAESMGLSREDVVALHVRYLTGLARLALSDGVVTAGERDDLMKVAALLGLTSDNVDAALQAAAERDDEVCAVNGFSLKRGDTVVFTGEAPGMSREALEYQARALGLRVAGAVSRNTTLVVAADPDSLSGKARKARDLKIPLVDYSAYLRMLDLMQRCGL
ncbi:MAG: DNA polymerase III subunit epsilon [Firmicutes bacterium ADurb.Bin506]|nr:MAG: DNA polymerase III subunit epsilon [Firmicutes bacterium ADurb.Bin506]